MPLLRAGWPEGPGRVSGGASDHPNPRCPMDTLVGVRSSWDAVANALVDAADALEVPRAV